MTIDRREFLTGATALAGTVLIAAAGCSPDKRVSKPDTGKIRKISEVTTPLAITMIDYSWMLKHHRYGAYEDYDKFFNELVERGYNAVRMDCFPIWLRRMKTARFRKHLSIKKKTVKECFGATTFRLALRPVKA